MPGYVKEKKVTKQNKKNCCLPTIKQKRTRASQFSVRIDLTELVAIKSSCRLNLVIPVHGQVFLSISPLFFKKKKIQKLYRQCFVCFQTSSRLLFSLPLFLCRWGRSLLLYFGQRKQTIPVATSLITSHTHAMMHVGVSSFNSSSPLLSFPCDIYSKREKTCVTAATAVALSQTQPNSLGILSKDVCNNAKSEREGQRKFHSISLCS